MKTTKPSGVFLHNPLNQSNKFEVARKINYLRRFYKKANLGISSIIAKIAAFTLIIQYNTL